MKISVLTILIQTIRLLICLSIPLLTFGCGGANEHQRVHAELRAIYTELRSIQAEADKASADHEAERLTFQAFYETCLALDERTEKLLRKQQPLIQKHLPIDEPPKPLVEMHMGPEFLYPPLTLTDLPIPEVDNPSLLPPPYKTWPIDELHWMRAELKVLSAYAKAIKQMLDTMPPINPADPSTPVEEQALFSKLVSHSNQLHHQFSQYRKLYRTNAEQNN